MLKKFLFLVFLLHLSIGYGEHKTLNEIKEAIGNISTLDHNVNKIP